MSNQHDNLNRNFWSNEFWIYRIKYCYL